MNTHVTLGAESKSVGQDWKSLFQHIASVDNIIVVEPEWFCSDEWMVHGFAGHYQRSTDKIIQEFDTRLPQVDLCLSHAGGIRLISDQTSLILEEGHELGASFFILGNVFSLHA